MQSQNPPFDGPVDALSPGLDSDRQFMQAALDQARLAYAKSEIPIGAVAVYRGQIIARGHN